MANCLRVCLLGFVRRATVVLSLLSAAAATSQEVVPDFYLDPGLYPNRDYVNQSYHEHIDPFTGALQLHYVDLHIPGNGGLDLKVVRSYNSVSVNPTNPAAYQSLAGLGWTVHFGRVLRTKDTNICYNRDALKAVDNPVLEMPDGSRQLLSFTGLVSPLMLTTQRWKAECSTAGTQGLVVYSPDGLRYDMTQLVNVGTGVSPVYAWHTTKITDKNGNYANIAYSATYSPEITSVTASDGRTITFTYADSGLATRRITSVNGAGQTYNYGYQAVSGVLGAYYLTSVTRPGGTMWQYAYNGNLNSLPGSYIMSQVVYPEGGYNSFGYSWIFWDTQSNPYSRTAVVSSKSSSTGANWTYGYAPGSPGAYDTTTVNTPAGTIVYQHIGPNYSSSGTVWMVGLLVSKTLGGAQSEVYSWGKQKISSETYYRPGVFVLKNDYQETNAPVLTQKVITRDGATHSTSYSGFDSYGNPTSISETGPNGGTRATSLSYYINTSKWIVKQVQNESFIGSASTRVFDSNGNLTSLTRNGIATSYTYDAQGNVASVTFPRGLTHIYTTYKRGIPQSEAQPEGILLSRVVSDAGNVTSETNGDGRTTTFGYDGLNRVNYIGYPIGNAVSISYGVNSKTATRGALVEATNYNGFGEKIGVTLGGISRTYTVDPLGRITFASNPGAVIGTNYQYDILSRVTRVTSADGTTRSTVYGPAKKTLTDERGKSTAYNYRSYGNPEQQHLMSITAADASANVSIVRNAVDLATSITQAGLTRGFGYNSSYYLTTVTNPETGTTSYGRDAAGNMTTRAVGTSGVTTYTYDGQNRATTVTYPGATPAVTNTYNKSHKLLTANSTGGSRSFVYDANGNLTGETLLIDGYTLGATYTYNSLDQLSSVTYPVSGRVVSYTPDALGRPTAVSGYISSVTYWPSGQVRQIAYANGTVTNYGQNSRLWPSNFVTQKTGGTTYISSNYSYDGVGNLTGISDTVDTSYNRTISYDNINRLTGISGPWGAGTIAYSGAGNITSQVFGGTSLYYAYDTTNRLSSVSGTQNTSFGYDAYGDMVSAYGNAYAYDGVPNFRCFKCSDTLNKIEYTYDGINRRSSVTKAGVKSYEMHDSKDTQLIEYTPSLSNKLIEYIYLGGKRIAQRVSP
jgi:YD repeat-containing protein